MVSSESEGVAVVGIKWSFITVTFNSSSVLAAHWRSGRAPDVEWIVVDNASVDGSAETARELGADHVIKLEQNVGFGAANNLGFGCASGEIVAFVNPDVVVDYASLSVLEDALRAAPSIVGPQLVYPNEQPQPSGRGAPNLFYKVLSRLGLQSVSEKYYLYTATNEIREVAWITGAAVVGFRDTFSLLGPDGPWDPRFFVYYEDSDLCLRAWLQGIAVRVVGDVRWVHSWARDTASFRFEPWRLELGSMRKFYQRYPSFVFGVTGGKKLRTYAHRWGAILARSP